MCGLAITHEGSSITSIRGDDDDPLSRGHICPKALALGDLQDDPDRLRTPVRRTATGWEPMAWDDALALVAERLGATRREHGRRAVAAYQGNPTVHSSGAILFGTMLWKELGAQNFSATSVDQLPHMLAALEMFGHQLLLPVPDVDRTQHLLVLGANPVVSNGSLMTAPGIGRRLRAIRDRGGRVVVVDPRRTETAELADEHVAVRPGADAWLLLAMLEAIFSEGLARPGRLATWSDGLDVVRTAAARFPAERVAARVGVDAPTIRRLARELAEARQGVVYGRIGICLQQHGTSAAWLVNVLNVVIGALDAPGGAMFTRPAFDLVGLASRIGMRGAFGRWRSRVRGLPEFGGELPVAALAEEIDTPGEGRVRALVTAAGNPVLSTPNGRRLDAALASLDFMVSVDFYVNETTRHAHVILPPTAPLERDHYDVAFHALAVRNTAKWSPPLLPRPEGALHDWEIFLELATRLGAQGGARARAVAWAQRAALGKLGPRGVVDLALRTGAYGAGRGGLSVAALEAEPHGRDLGALEPCLPGRLFTRHKRIALAPPTFVAELAWLDEQLAVAPPALVLIGRREARTNNSWLHNSERLVKGPERCTLRMHPDDARARSLSAGARVRVSSRVGAVEVTLETTDELRPGVVSLPHGWGHGRAGVRLRVASAHPGVSVNDLTDETLVDSLSGTAALNGVEVRVEGV